MNKTKKVFLTMAVIGGLIYGVYKGGKACFDQLKKNWDDAKSFYELQIPNQNNQDNIEKYIKIDEKDNRIFSLEQVVAKKGDTIEQLLLNNGINVYEKQGENRSEWYNLFRYLNNLGKNEHIIAGKTYWVPKLVEYKNIEDLINDQNWQKIYYPDY
ncbi:MAG: hypothetical protein QXU20_04760 [Candidatus Woesearchaeota archaeon]